MPEPFSQFPALCQEYAAQNPEDIVPQEGVEPSRLAAAAFEVAVSTIPPPGHCLVDIFLYVIVNRPLYGTRTRVTSLKGRRP